MKRSHALQPLSRDHHEALAIALKLRRAQPDTMASDRGAFLSFWRSHGRRHFEIEERILLPAFTAHTGDAPQPLVERVLAEHVAIGGRANELERDPETRVWALRQLGDLLSDHVRFEEKAFFPLVEETLPSNALAALADALEEAESRG